MNVLGDAGDTVELRRRGLREADLVRFLSSCRNDPRNGNQDVRKARAQWFADALDSVC